MLHVKSKSDLHAVVTDDIAACRSVTFRGTQYPLWYTPHMAEAPNPIGRPTEYRQEFVVKVYEMAQSGATDMEIADELGVSVRTLYRWKAVHSDFRQALKVAKEIADERVVRSLYQRAIGYEQDSVKIFMPKDADEPVYAPFREMIAPDTTAAIFWLKNRQSQDWREKQEMVHSLDESLKNRLKEARARRNQ